jgi:predicted enzyme related to lactoylglutathione lyase
MANDLKHFAINADDVERARRFYQGVFGWKIEPWGPPGFYLVTTGDASVPRGAVQGRRELIKGQRMLGFECTFSVADVDAVAKSVLVNGGRIVMEKATIPGVGELIFFQDPEGNVAGAMRYDTAVE